MSDERIDLPRAVLVGSAPGVELPCVERAADVPPSVLVIAVAQPVAAGDEMAAALRASHPEARLLAYVPNADETAISWCLDSGYDDVVVSARHLAHRVSATLQELDWIARFEDERAVHDGLVSFIGEISLRPELQDVLRTAVVRLSELLSIDRVSVVLFTPGEEVGFVVMENERSLLDNIVIRLADYPELAEMIRTREPLVIPDVFGDDLLAGVRSKLERAERPHRAAILFPLVRKGQAIGALFVRSRDPVTALANRLLGMGRLLASVTSVALGSALERDLLVHETRSLRRKKAQADEALAGLRQFVELFERAHDGIVVTDRAGAIRYANDSAGSVLRRDPPTLKGQRFLDLLAPYSQASAERALRGDEVGDAHGYVDLVVPMAGEGETVISAAIRALNEPEGVFISFRDVTELREIESELRQTKEFLENLIQSSVDAIVAADIDGRVILFNHAAEQILGYPAREAVGRLNAKALYAPGEAAEVMRRLRSEAYGGRGRLEVMRKDLISKTGELVPVNMTAAIIYEEGREIATVGIFTDLRERIRIEEKLSQVQRQLQLSERQAVAVELAGAAAHELNQPLTSILGYAEILRRGVPEGDGRRKPVDVIIHEVERMAAIVKKIGQITAYQTKAYVGEAKILNLADANGGDESEKDR